MCSFLALAGMGGTFAGAAPASINIDASNRQQITGWGIYTENRPDWNPVGEFNISQNPLACDALYGPKGIGANVLRMAFPPQCYVSDGVLDTNLMNGMKRHVMAGVDRGIQKWFVSLWSPPASMKEPATTAGTTDGTPNVRLRPDSEDRFVQYCADLVLWMKGNGVPLPHSFSFQNEPGWHPWYEGCTYSPEQYQRVAKKLRAKFDASGLTAVLLNCNDGAQQKDTLERLGLTPNRDGAFDKDATLRSAVGVISTHTYDLHNGLWNWYSNGLQEYYNATRDRAQEKWMTEWEVVTNGDFKVTSEWDILRENVRHFNRDLSTLQFNTWVYWQTWHAKSPTSLDQKRSFVNGTTTINRNTSYYAFRKIWQNAAPSGGTFMRQVTTTDPDLKGASFSNWHQDFSCFINKNKMVLVVCNPTDKNKTLDINGLVGRSATLHRYISGQAANYNVDMTQVGTYPIARGKLPNAFIVANSVNVFVTDGKSQTGGRAG
jgi:O-glycosyl hydrolase